MQFLPSATGAYVIEATHLQGHRTRYYIDARTATVTKLEAITGTGTSAIGGTPMVTTDVFAFTDFRQIQGVLTPFGTLCQWDQS